MSTANMDEYEVPPRGDGSAPSLKMKPNGLSACGMNVRAGLASVLASIALSGCVVNGYE